VQVKFRSLLTPHILKLLEYEVKKYVLLFFLIVQYMEHKIVMYCERIMPGLRISISELDLNVLFHGSINLLTGICNKYVS